jgi:hypothetical protein
MTSIFSVMWHYLEGRDILTSWKNSISASREIKFILIQWESRLNTSDIIIIIINVYFADLVPVFCGRNTWSPCPYVCTPEGSLQIIKKSFVLYNWKGSFESKHKYLMLLSLFKLTTRFGLCTGPSSVHKIYNWGDYTVCIINKIMWITE